MSATPPLFIAGLDLGRPHQFTALAVLERTEMQNPKDPDRTIRHYAVRHLERLSPATPYPEVFARLAEVFAAPPLRVSRLVVDYTGVGRPVVDMLRKARVGAKIIPLFVTWGIARRRTSVAVGRCRDRSWPQRCKSCYSLGGCGWRRRFPSRRCWCGSWPHSR